LLVYDTFTDFSTLSFLVGDIAETDWRIGVGKLLNLVVSVAVIVNYCRFVILKEALDFYSLAFFKRVFLYIIASVLFALSLIIPAAIISAIASIASLTWLYSVGAVAILVIAVLLSPIFIYFASITVDDKTLTLKEAFKLAKGNCNKIFWGALLIMVPCSILTILFGYVYGMVMPDTFLTKLLFSAMLIIISLLDTCLKSSFFAHIYQYFTFYKNREI